MELEKPNPTLTTSEPSKLVGGFLDSQEYKTAFNKYYEGKNIRPDVTEEIMHKVFQEKEEARLAFIGFSKNKMHFQYDPTTLTPEINEAINLYTQSAIELKKAQTSGDRDKIIDQDAFRSAAHNALADRLTLAGVTPSKKVGLGLAGLILLSQGLQTYDSLLENRDDKIQARYR